MLVVEVLVVERLAGVGGLRSSEIAVEAGIGHVVRSTVSSMISIRIVRKDEAIVAGRVPPRGPIVRDQRDISVGVAVASGWNCRVVSAVVSYVSLGARCGWERCAGARATERIQGGRYRLWWRKPIVAVGCG